MKPQFSYEYAAPPALFEKFLNWCLPESLKEPVVGDLAEEFSQKVSDNSLAKANLWYMRQAALTSMQYMWKTKRGMMMFIFGILFFIAMFLMALVISGEIWMFLNIPSFLVVIPPAVFLTIGITSKNTFGLAFRLILDEDLEADLTTLKRASHVFAVMGNSGLWLGVLGAIIGHIAMASNIEPERFSTVFGPAFAVSLLTLLYALLFKVLCYVGEHKINHRIIDLQQN